MTETRGDGPRRWLRISAAVLLLAGSVSRPARSASVSVDLDAAGGAESTVHLNVLRAFPPLIRNQVTNRAVGHAFDIDWPSAGPGGLETSAGAGTSAGVGAIWEWSTIRQVYSLTCSTTDVEKPCMTALDTTTASPRGPYVIPGRSIVPSGVTTSSASLTSSLLKFFSPPLEVLRVTSEVVPVETGGFRYRTMVENLSGDPVDFEGVAGPLGCLSKSCPMGTTNCDGVCCGYAPPLGCDVAAAGVVCPFQSCNAAVFPQIFGVSDDCDADGFCDDLLFDPNNCGMCGLDCGSGACLDGGCVLEVPEPCQLAGGSGPLAPFEARVLHCGGSAHPAMETSSQVEVACASPPCAFGSGGRGMVNVLVPDDGVTIGDVFLSVSEVLVQDPNGNEIPEPGETVQLTVRLVNAGSQTLSNVNAVLSAPAADVDEDLLLDPIAIPQPASTYPAIAGAPIVPGTVLCGDAQPLALAPGTNDVAFSVEVPPGHPGDVARALVLSITGQYGTGNTPYAQDVRLVLGIGPSDPCDFDAVPPEVTIHEPAVDQLGLPPVRIPIRVVFESDDDDGVTGEVIHEALKLQGCVLHDGDSFGDRDGLLSDEGIQLNRYTLCQAMARCGFFTLYYPRISIEATDSCGNTGSEGRIIRRRLLRSEVCR